MEKGFNSDVPVVGSGAGGGGESYHVQTEDWGFDNPYLVTRVYRAGAVIESIKTPYSDVLRNRNAFLLLRNKAAMSEALQDAMRDQHRRIVERYSGPDLDRTGRPTRAF